MNNNLKILQIPSLVNLEMNILHYSKLVI